MRKRIIYCAILILNILQAQAMPGVYDVHDFGAKGDGKTLDHTAINRAIETANANGGGQVVLTPGTYLCGSIRLRSNVDLHLLAGAKILAAPAIVLLILDFVLPIRIVNRLVPVMQI